MFVVIPTYFAAAEKAGFYQRVPNRGGGWDRGAKKWAIWAMCVGGCVHVGGWVYI